MKTFTEYMNEAKRTDLINDGGESAKIDRDKTFQENVKLLTKKVNSAIKRLEKKAANEVFFRDKCKDVQTVLNQYEILGKRLDKGEIHKDDVIAIKNKFNFLMDFCSKKIV
jgi:hypothetical protein